MSGGENENHKSPELAVFDLVWKRLAEAELALKAARQLLQGLEERYRQGNHRPLRDWPLAERVKKACAREFDVPLEWLEEEQTSACVRARHAAIWILRRLTRASTPMLAGAFRRHHTTVIHALRMVARWESEDPELYQRVEALRARLAGELVGLPPDLERSRRAGLPPKPPEAEA